MDHAKNPRNYGELKKVSHQAQGDNPMCGDHLELYLKIEQGLIKDLSFTGSGCAITRASASLMGEEIIGQSIASAAELADQMLAMLNTGRTQNLGRTHDLANKEKLLIFKNVREFPGRVKCASLAWHTLRQALKQKSS